MTEHEGTAPLDAEYVKRADAFELAVIRSALVFPADPTKIAEANERRADLDDLFRKLVEDNVRLRKLLGVITWDGTVNPHCECGVEPTDECDSCKDLRTVLAASSVPGEKE